MKYLTIILVIILGSSAVFAQSADHSAMMSKNSSSGIKKTDKYLELNQAMRKLWSEHMFWTLATVDAFFNEPKQLDVKLNRLLQNQKDIGAAIVPFYGQAAGDKLAALLTEHIQLAVPVLKAAQSNDKPALDVALANWHKNAKDVADFLSTANPKNWPASVTESALKMHIDQTTGYAVNILKGEFAPSLKGFEEAYNHMLHLADILSDGIAKQFPDKL